MPRRLHTWKLRTRELALGDRTLIMGVLNVTPDSFSDGGQFLDPDRAYARALEMEEHGADIIDIGAESTRPGAHPITAAEEMQRLMPVLKRLRDKLTIPISIDTYKAEVAERALELGADIINDPSGFTFDPQIAKPVVQYDAGLIFNHMRGRPETWATLGPMQDVMGSIVKDLDAAVSRARRAGVDRLRIVIDPGIGFGKRREQNSEILARIEEMMRLELPIMVGASRKSFLAQANERETEFATAAAVTASILGGAHLVRVHDIVAMKAVVAVTDEIVRVAQRLKEARESGVVETPARRGRVALVTPEVEATPIRPPVRPPLVKPMAPPVIAEPVLAEATESEPLAAEAETETAAAAPLPVEETPRPARTFDRPRPAGGGDRPSRPPFRRDDSRPSAGGDRPSRPPFRRDDSRPSAGGERPSRPPFRRDDSRPSAGGDRPSRPPFRRDDSRPSAGGDRPSRPPFRRDDSRPSAGGDRPSRPPFRRDDSRPSAGGDRPARPPFRRDDSRPPAGGDRPSRPPFRRDDSRPSAGGDRPSRPPFRRDDSRPSGGGDRPARPSFGDRGAHKGPPRASSKGPSNFRPKGPYKSGPPKGKGPRPDRPRRND